MLRNMSANGKSRADIRFLGYEIARTVEQAHWGGGGIVHNRAECEREGDTFRVTTPVEQWAAAVEFPLQKSPSISEKKIILKLHARVYQGEIGLVLLAASSREALYEIRVTAGEKSELVEIALPKGAALPSLMLRNTSADGRSRADIEFLGYEIAQAAEPAHWTASGIVHNRADCRREGDRLRVVTPEEQWASAVEFQLQRSASDAEKTVTLKPARSCS